ncbi:MAG: hypothetical protein ACK5PB_17530 [Pirellula sp.]
MKRLLIIVFVLFFVIVVGGFYQKWFTVSNPSSSDRNKTNINFEIDSGKMRQDADSLTTQEK